MYQRSGGTLEAMNTKESTMTMMIKKEDQNPYHHQTDIPSDPFSSVLAPDTFWSNHVLDDQKSSLGFMELLGFQDFATTKYSAPSSSFGNTMMMYHRDQLPPSSSKEIPTSSAPHDDDDDDDDVTVSEVGEESSVVLNMQPPSPNSSSLSSPPAAAAQPLPKPLKQCMRRSKNTKGGEESKTKTKKKKERAARFAFMTRTEIDHLDDGYRWRKYGQKAVKNSPFPRSYYRCTSSSCNVKKRVERCMGDPSFVVTTYEGQHIHPSPCAAAPLNIPSSFNHRSNIILNPIPTTYANSPPAIITTLHQGGLLQDMLP